MKKELKKLPKFSYSNLVAVIVVLIMTNITAILWYLYETRPEAIRSIENPYPLLDPSRSFIAQEHFLSTINPLRERVREMVDQYEDGDVSVYVEYLNTGANISINPEKYIWPASLTKVPLALAVIKKIENREWEYHSELVLLKGDANRFSGDSKNPLSEYPIGTRFTIEKLLEELLVNSDNTAYFMFLRNLHEDDLRGVVVNLGMDKLFTPEGRISAKEYTRILRALYTASFLNRENSQRVLKWLDKSSFEEFLSSGLPDNIMFSHKFGEDDTLRVYSDSGIVYVKNRPYMIAAMVQGNKDKPHEDEQRRAAAFMRSLSSEVYAFFSSK